MHTQALFFTTLLFLPFTLPTRHVIRNTERLRQQGIRTELELGGFLGLEPLGGGGEGPGGEGPVGEETRESCVGRCETHPECRAVMLMGGVCWLYASYDCACSEQLTHVVGASRYLLGTDVAVRTFETTMDKCRSLGAHALHINSAEEHQMIKDYVVQSGLYCPVIMTGGYSPIPGSPDLSDWRWYYDAARLEPSQPFTYILWGRNQPNNNNGFQYFVGLDQNRAYDFNDYDVGELIEACYVCECP